MILCGGVLTAIVGVCGLLERLAKDKVLPEQLAIVSSWGSTYVAIVCFVIFCVSLFLTIFDPANPIGIKRFGGVFTIAFLSVLAAFSFAALLLKIYRSNLARLVITKWWHVVFSFVAVLLGLIGNIVLTPDVFVWFLVYLAVLMCIVGYMFIRVHFLSIAIWMIRLCEKRHKHRDISEDTLTNSQLISAYGKQYQFEEFDFLRCSGSNIELNRHNDLSSTRMDFLDSDEETKEQLRLSWKASSKQFSDEEKQSNDSNSNEIPACAQNTRNGRILSCLSKSLDSIVNEPFAVFAKHPNPITLHVAIEYIVQNEQSDSIFIIHFVDDRKYYQSSDVMSSVEQEEECGELRGLESITLSGVDQLGEFPDQKQTPGKYSDDNHEDGVDMKKELFLQKISKGWNDNNPDNSYGLFDKLSTTLPREARHIIDCVAILDTCYT